MIPQLRSNSASEPGYVLSSLFRKSILREYENIAKLRRSWPSFLKICINNVQICAYFKGTVSRDFCGKLTTGVPEIHFD
jgi:hypothetical protein